VVKECTNFVEPCLLYSAVIAETGSRKTPLLNIPKAPLVKLQAEEDARYKAELDAYQKELDAYNHRPKENKDDEPPVPPHPPREFYVDNVTVESLDEIKGCQPDKAFTMIKDELSGCSHLTAHIKVAEVVTKKVFYLAGVAVELKRIAVAKIPVSVWLAILYQSLVAFNPTNCEHYLKILQMLKESGLGSSGIKCRCVPTSFPATT
jgi:hypothetical protein